MTASIGEVRPLLVTGGAGFIGSNLCDRLAREGEHVLILDNLSRGGAAENLQWLRRRHPRLISVITGDIRDVDAVAAATASASAVFHLAAQVAVTTSLADPLADFSVNLQGTMLLLDALRRQPRPMVFASTNKVYGDLADVALAMRDGAWLPVDPALRNDGIAEDRPVAFHTPYGCSKGAADQYVLDWARSFAVPSCVLRMSCIYGTRQRGTEDQGWVAHFVLRALAGAPVTIFGDGRQVRDVLFVDNAVDAYVAAWRRIGAVAGQAFNLGGGATNGISLRQLIARLEQLLGRRLPVAWAPWRTGDQKWFVADMRRARAALDLPAAIGWEDGVGRMVEWCRGAGLVTAMESAA